ncbi:multi antimicrobial extrusion protein MatE [Paenibacillus flagellatus]|uniref:Multi antimicrobial extrusion protein MatE n=1 Tax=Paenibacillus flagellatus TaxID=2211139 RepID=A0A2V5KDT2_9BACL|nr:multi antimicrobial extrusion protein MatE [Paenibacillus flagellatus]PYI56414.1 multi antimicrobial extrusion protein MatE [Paenibacillus flagellatus]
MTNTGNERRLTMGQLFAFFIPLGLSASLVTISHVIINSTLARSADPEIIIASYAIGLSMLGIIERPAILLRQTCSALVRDRTSFKAMTTVAVCLLIGMFGAGLLISYTPVGRLLFLRLFGVDESMLLAIIHVYRILMFVSIFSGIRCLYHGIIISNMRTKWLTIGMAVRLAAMYAVSMAYIHLFGVESGQVGAVIFLVGMVIEAALSYWEGSKLAKTLPLKKAGHDVEKPGQIFKFYRPLLYSSFIAVMIGPSINAMLGKTADIELSIASFAIAASLAQLVQSFFSYMHQIVLNFYRKDAALAVRFVTLCAFVPTILIGLLAYTPAGPWFMEHVMGVNERLMTASLHTLRVFMLMTLLFPWLDFCNGLIMLRGQTKVTLLSQTANVTATVATLVLCVWSTPGWNGMIGALAQSIGIAAELAVVAFAIRSASAAAVGRGTGAAL